MLEVKATNEVGTVGFNYEEMKSTLEGELKKYEGLVITDESQITEFKATKAELNKVKKAINDEKIRIKKEYCIPLVEFENKVKDLIAMIDSVNIPIDNQLKEYEEKRKASRRSKIVDFYNGSGFTLVPVEKLIDESWLNKSVTDKKWMEEFDYKLQSIKSAFETIEMMGDKEYVALVKSFYLDSSSFDNLAIGEAKQKADNLLKIKEKVDPVIERVDHAQEMQEEQNQEVEEEMTMTFTVTTTKSKLIKIREFMKELGAKYE